MHRCFLSAGSASVDADCERNRFPCGVHTLASVVGVHEASSAFAAHLTGFAVRIPRRIVGRLDFWLFLLDAHLQGFSLALLCPGIAITHGRGPVIWRNVTLVEHVVDATIDERVVGLELIRMFGTLRRDVDLFVAHATILPPTPPVSCHPVTNPQMFSAAATPPRGLADVVVACFVGLLLIANVAATKLIELGPAVSVGGVQVLPLITDGGAIVFPLTYILGDVLAEVYGLRRARRTIVLGFALSLAMSATLLLVGMAPPSSDWHLQDAWVSVLGFVPRIVLASLLAYLVGQLLNAWVLVLVKRRTGERRLWVRLLTSTVVGEFVDTLLFCTIAFGPFGVWLGGGSIPLPTLLNYIAVGFVYKVAMEAALLPVTYRVIAAVKRVELDASR